nr:VirK/YbjX family protein [uncultured Enterobacter sp.]
MSQITANTYYTSGRASPLQLFMRLVRGQLQPGKFWQKASFRRKFLLRSLLMPRATARLLENIAQWPELNMLLNSQPRLPVRLHRPYLAANITREVALDALCFHYNAMRVLLNHEQMVSYLGHAGLNLATFEAKDGTRFTLDFLSLVSLDKEGESTVVIRDEQQRVLAEITFTCCLFNHQRTLFIGGLQGAANDVPHEVIQQATKACSGLFPKRIVMEALCQVAKALRAERILAVSNDVHIYRTWRYRDKKTQMHADYDAFWLSLGGEKVAGEYFSLPLTIARKSESDIASKKRAEYRRRYALLDTVVGQVPDRLRR